MAYEKTAWVNDQTPLSEANLNKIEDGIKEAHDANAQQQGQIDTLHTIVNTEHENRLSVNEQHIEEAHVKVDTLKGRVDIIQPEHEGMLSGTVVVKKAERDSNNNVIVDTYATKSQHNTAINEIDKIKDGTTIVKKSERDGNNNVIATHYETKADALAHKNDQTNPHGVTPGQIGAEPANPNIQGHIIRVDNPHQVTKAQVGLGNVENKSSATIRSEITKQNIEAGLGYKPAELDEHGILLPGQVPGSYDDVIEVPNFTGLPTTGENGKIYVTIDTNIPYRWTGTTYIAIGSQLAIGQTAQTAHRGDHGKAAYDHSLVQGNPHNTTADQVGAYDKAAIDAQMLILNQTIAALTASLLAAQTTVDELYEEVYMVNGGSFNEIITSVVDGGSFEETLYETINGGSF
jgi:hypothetical protein